MRGAPDASLRAGRDVEPTSSLVVPGGRRGGAPRMRQECPDLVAKPRFTRERGLALPVMFDHDERVVLLNDVSTEDAHRARGRHHEGDTYPDSGQPIPGCLASDLAALRELERRIEAVGGHRRVAGSRCDSACEPLGNPVPHRHTPSASGTGDRRKRNWATAQSHLRPAQPVPAGDEWPERPVGGAVAAGHREQQRTAQNPGQA